MVTGSVERGTAGAWVTSVTKGAELLLATELARPGVPPTALLDAQFWPDEFGRVGLINIRGCPKPLAPMYQDHPEKPSSCTKWATIDPVPGVAGVPETVMLKVLTVTPEITN